MEGLQMAALVEDGDDRRKSHFPGLGLSMIDDRLRVVSRDRHWQTSHPSVLVFNVRTVVLEGRSFKLGTVRSC
ncbi:hypothetical protein D3C87_2144710 [compost metagenome]